MFYLITHSTHFYQWLYGVTHIKDHRDNVRRRKKKKKKKQRRIRKRKEKEKEKKEGRIRK